MSAARPIQIVGGGLAGLTLGITLRQRGIPVTVFEAGNYPRHRVCGEFINGKGIEILESLGLKQKLLDAGAITAKTAAFFVRRLQSPIRQLPRQAICLSRFVLDKLLADEFQILGGDLRVNTRWSKDFGEGDVRASGRRVQPVENGWRWFGLKAQAKNVFPAADLEMHLLRNGYVGICKLAGGTVDICGLFRRANANESSENIFDLLRGDGDTILRERLANAVFDGHSFCAVAGLPLKPQRVTDQNEICIGDALTMIPPVTGNGMSLAFESAQIAAQPLADFSRGGISWTQTRQNVVRLCNQTFSARLRWANWLQRILFASTSRNLLFNFVSRSDWAWRMAFERTR